MTKSQRIALPAPALGGHRALVSLINFLGVTKVMVTHFGKQLYCLSAASKKLKDVMKVYVCTEKLISVYRHGSRFLLVIFNKYEIILRDLCCYS